MTTSLPIRDHHVAAPDQDEPTPPVVGSEEMIGFITREHLRTLEAYAGRLTGDASAAQDVVQETLIRAWKHRDNLAHRPGSVRGWLHTVARNVVIDGVRRERRADRTTRVAPLGDHAAAVADRVTLVAALRRLSVHHREVLFHVYVEDRSVADTARILGLAEGTVKSRTHYAVRALRGELIPDEARMLDGAA